MKVGYNPANTEDLSVIADVMAASLLEEGDVYFSGNLTIAPRSAVRTFLAGKASSFAQVGNLIRFLRTLPDLYRASLIYIFAPAPVVIIICLAAMLLRKKAHIVVHDVVPHYGGVRGLIYGLQNRLIFRAAERVYVFSRYSAETAASRYGFHAVTVLPLPSPAERIEMPQPGVAPTHDFVWWGRPEEYKGTELLVPLAGRLATQGLTLLVISDLAQRPELSESLRRCPNVEVVSKRLTLSELGAQLRRAKVNVCPYIHATQSGVISFATCIGLPTIAHNVGGLGSQIREGMNGFVVSTVEDIDLAEFARKCSEINTKSITDFYDANCSFARLVNVLKG